MPRTPVAAPARPIPVVDSTGRPIRCGQRVRIPKYARVLGLKDGSNYTWRAYTITVRDAIDGIAANTATGDEGLEPRITWGSLGSIRETSASHVTIVD